MTTIAAAVLPTRLRELREAIGMFRTDLAKRAGIPYSELVALESGTRKAPVEPELVAKLASVLKVSPGSLFESGTVPVKPSKAELKKEAVQKEKMAQQEAKLLHGRPPERRAGVVIAIPIKSITLIGSWRHEGEMLIPANHDSEIVIE